MQGHIGTLLPIEKVTKVDTREGISSEPDVPLSLYPALYS